MRTTRFAIGLGMAVLCSIGSLVYGQAGTSINAQDYLNADGTANQAKIKAAINIGKDACELARQLITADPKHAKIFTRALVTLAPDQAVCITQAAVRAVPSQADGIAAEAVRAAPAQAAAIRAAATEVLQALPPPPEMTVAEVTKGMNDAVDAALKEIALLTAQGAAQAGEIKGVSKE